MSEELLQKINDMSYEELVSFKSVASVINIIVNLLGMGAILLALNIPNIFMIIGGAFAVYLLSGLSVAMVQTKKYVMERIEKLKDK
jgi:hypothetical protein